MAKTYHISPRLRFEHPWLNRPDTKFNEDGLFHVKGIGAGDQVEKMKAVIQAAAEAALAEHVQEMKPMEAKKWGLYVPMEEVEDDNGVATGETKFDFKQNAKITLRDKTTKDIAIELRDAKDNIVDVPIFGGTEGRIMYTLRPIVMTSSKQVGVRLDFFKVQVIKLAERKGGGAGFGAVDDEDAFVASEKDASFGQGQADEEQAGDY